MGGSVVRLNLGLSSPRASASLASAGRSFERSSPTTNSHTAISNGSTCTPRILGQSGQRIGDRSAIGFRHGYYDGGKRVTK